MDHNSPIILHCEHSRALPPHPSRARRPGDIAGPIAQDEVIAGVWDSTVLWLYLCQEVMRAVMMYSGFE